jgi:transposase
MTATTFPIEIDLPGVEIEGVQLTREGSYEIRVSSTLTGCSCHKCGQAITKPHGHDRELRLRHLPIFGKETFILICLPRFQCLACPGKPTTTQQVAWHVRRSPHTTAYERPIILTLIGRTVEEVSVQEGIGYEAVMGIIRRHIQSEVDWDKLAKLEQVGLDEISLKKGHKDFVTIVSARIEGHIELLAVLKDRKKKTVKAFLQSLPDRLKKTVKSVCSDLYDGFINAAKEVFCKRTSIVVDRFHVARLYRKGLDTLRKQELKRLKEELSEEDYRELKGAMWGLRKKKEKLTREDKTLLKKLFNYSFSLETAYQLQNELTNIFEMNLSRSGGKRRIKNWMGRVKASGIKCYQKFMATLDSYFEHIVNYFIHRHSSGFVEGFNNKIKVIKRRCYGLLNAQHLFQRIVLDISGRSAFAL